MAIKNRADLLAFLREKAAYNGGEDLAAVKSFVTENVELSDESGNAIDVETIWNIVPKSKVKAVASATAQAEDDEARLSGANVTKSDEGRVSSKATRAYEGVAPTQRDSAKKAYDAKIARSKSLPVNRQAHFDDADQAEAAGAWFRLSIAGSHDYPQRKNDEGILGKTMITTTNSLGGALVPNEFSANLIDLREKFGGIIGTRVAIEPMREGLKDVPRQTGDLTVYAVGEGSAPTASDMAFDNVSLTAKKLGVLAYVSSELFNDAAVSVADRLAYNIVWSFNKALERDLFLGDGTAAYHGFLGIAGKVRKVLEDGGGTWTTDADKLNLAGWASATGNTFAEVTEANLLEVRSRYPVYEMGSNPCWYTSEYFYRNVMLRLAVAKGGVTGSETVNCVTVNRWHGDEVVITNAMPRVDANSQVAAVFGDLNMGLKVGEVTGSMSIASSTDFAFSTDVITYRGLTRNAITVHDVGNYSATAASRVAGPICGLITLNS